MTREHKLALIVGFALVLAVAVLISDHFSGASRANGGTIIAETPIRAGSGLDRGQVGGREVAFDLPAARLIESTPTPDAPADAPINQLADNSGGGTSVLEHLANSVRTALDDLSNGHTPPSAIQTEVLEMGKPLGGGEQPANSPVSDIDPRDLKRHNVQDKETLWSIAAKYYGDGKLYKELAAFNKGRVGDGGTVHPGVTLLIPTKSALLGGPANPSATPGTPSVTPKTEPAKKPAGTREYTVKSGDTLGDIAKKELGSAKRWREIVDLNKDVISDPDNVAAGTKIKLPRN